MGKKKTQKKPANSNKFSFKKIIQKILPKRSPKQIIQEKIKWVKDNWPEIKEWASSTEGIVVGALSVIVLFVIVSIVQSCTPRKGTILYGMCGAFLEQQVPYPETIQHSHVEQYRKAVRIYYTHTDSFGQYMMRKIECAFVQDPEKGVQLESVILDHIDHITHNKPIVGKGKLYQVRQEYVDKFNESKSPSAILLNEPNIILPEPKDLGF
ncbi:MAG: hypothetical protein MRY79_04795 [Alphaproteobacteria bacterium]|nr:hypothetical protein [Alphaproteobacteria bacterium]